MRHRVLGFLALLGLILAAPSVILAQSRSVLWERWDVVIDDVDTTNNRFNVTEIYDVLFTGTFQFGSAAIPTDRLERIENVRVQQDGKALTASCSGAPGTFCVRNQQGEVSIVYHFFSPINNDRANIELSYDVVGALRSYPGGDQLWWDAVPQEHFGFPINSSTVTVYLPPDYAPREGVDPIETYGAPGEIQVNGSTVVARAARPIGGNEMFSLRVQYPHDPAGRAPAWQAAFDERRAFEENVQPLLSLGAVALSLLIGVGGLLFVFIRWQTQGRDPEVGPVPQFLSEPPGDLSPAVVGTLLDETADTRDIMSILIDLARRGYVVIEETRTEGPFGIGSNSQFVFKRTDKGLDGLKQFEKRMIQAVFGREMTRSLESLRNRFYKHIPALQNELYDALVAEGFFERSPQTTRTLWQVGGISVVGLSGVLMVFVFTMFIESVPTLVCVPFAGILVGLAMTTLGRVMPAKTQKGAEAAAKWRAFAEYLRNLERYSTVEEAAARFDEYLPYAIAFGLDRSWMRRFEKVPSVPIPPWYWPTYVGPYRRGYTPGTPLPRHSGGPDGLPGELARAGSGFSLDDMSGSFATGLESMSRGLSSMLDSAGRIITSQPSQSAGSGSWSSGGRGFSGGGFSGGGGSGGGSRGFG